MRKPLIWILALGAAIAIAVAGIAVAFKPTIIEAGNLVLKANGGVKPMALPKNTMKPITVMISGDISTKDGKHPPALRETVIDFDKNGTLNATGLPVCKKGQLENRATATVKKICKNAIVGSGSTKVVVEFAEQAPFTATGPLVLFNGGVKGGKTTMFIHAYVSVPAPTALVVPVTITKIHKGRYGIHTVAQLPVVAGGAGSTIHFDLNVNRVFKYKGKSESYVSAKCPDGKFFANILKAAFRDETGAGVGNATLSGTVIRPCTPKG